MKKEDILASCIDEVLAGRVTLKECLDMYPQHAEELQALLAIASSIPPETPAPSTDFKHRARNRLLEAMQTPTAQGKGLGATFFDWLKPLAPARRLSAPLIAGMLILVLLVTGSTTVFAAQNSLPDDTLYPVKTGTERLQLSLTLDTEDRAAFHLKLAQRRIEEVLTQSSLGRDITTSALEAIALQIDFALKELSNLPPEDTKPLLSQISESALNQQVTLNQIMAVAPESTHTILEQTLDATQRGVLISRIASDNPAVLASVPSVLDIDLEASYFELEGTLLGSEGETWNVGGLLLKGINYSQGTPPIGSSLEIEGLVRGAQVFISEIEREEEPESWIKIKGVFGGMSPDGRFWYIGGIPVPGLENVTPPPQGSQIELKGTMQEGAFTSTRIEFKEEDEEEDEEWRELDRGGVLVQVNPVEKIIVISVDSVDVTIHVSNALIKDQDGRPLSLQELESLIGKDIEVAGLYVKDGFLYAREVKVSVEQQEKDEIDKEKQPEEEAGQEEEEEDHYQEEEEAEEGESESDDEDSESEDD